MCSICPRCNPPQEYIDLPEGAPFGPFSPILPVPVDPDKDSPVARRWEYPIGGLICSCPPEDPADE